MQVPPFSLSTQLSEIGLDLDAAVLRVLRSGQYIGGTEVQAFEESFASSIGVSFAVSCNSGTDALILALRALDIGEGDEVITPSFSFFATAEAISAVGAKPVFVEVELSNYLIDLNQIEKAITSSTKAILPVHLFGCPVDMERLMKIASTHGLKIIEDCAQASGAFWKDRPVGSWGDIGCFSFFPTKNLGAAGDGGAVTTKDAQLSKRMRELAVHGMPRRYVHNELGYNSRLDAIQAAVLNVKLPKLSSWVKQRKLAAKRYQDLLKDVPGIVLPAKYIPEDMSHAWNQFVVRVAGSLQETTKNTILTKESTENNQIKFGKENLDSSCRDWLKERLLERGVNTIIYYPIPIHLQPAYKQLGYKLGSLHATEELCSQVLSLPIFPEITFEQQLYVANQLKHLLGKSNQAEVRVVA